MKRRSAILLFLFLCLVIAISIIVIARQRGPQYKGRALASWLSDLDGPETQTTARQALLDGGTNIVLGLLEIRFAQDNRFDSLLKLVGSRFNPSFRPHREQLRYSAAAALRTLGTNAAFAMIPLFETNSILLNATNNLLKNPFLIEQQPVSKLSDVMLFDLHTNSVPAFVAGLESSNSLIRFNLCYALVSRPTLEVHKNTNLARELILAITPSLTIQSTTNAPPSSLEAPLISMALHALRQLGVRYHNHEPIIPHAIDLLSHPHSGVRYNAAYFLKELAPKTQQVRTALQQALDKEKQSRDDDPMGVMMIGPRSKEALLGGLGDALQANQ